MHRIGELNFVWPTREKVAQIMQRSMRSPISITTVSTACAGTTTMIATTPNDLRLWKIFGGRDAFGNIWNVSTWSRHGGALLGNAPLLCLGRETYTKSRIASSPKPDFAATVSIYPHYFPAPMVLYQGFGDSSLDFKVLFWVNENILQVKSDINLSIQKEFENAGIHIPFPTRTIINSTPKQFEPKSNEDKKKDEDKGK